MCTVQGAVCNCAVQMCKAQPRYPVCKDHAQCAVCFPGTNWCLGQDAGSSHSSVHTNHLDTRRSHYCWREHSNIHTETWYGLVKCRFIICSSTSASGPETLSLLERAVLCRKKHCVSQGGVWRQETLLEHSARKRTVHCVSEKEVQLFVYTSTYRHGMV